MSSIGIAPDHYDSKGIGIDNFFWSGQYSATTFLDPNDIFHVNRMLAKSSANVRFGPAILPYINNSLNVCSYSDERDRGKCEIGIYVAKEKAEEIWHDKPALPATSLREALNRLEQILTAQERDAFKAKA